jgi:hypothetical protein
VAPYRLHLGTIPNSPTNRISREEEARGADIAVGSGDRRWAITSPGRTTCTSPSRRAMWPVRRPDGDPPPAYG